MLRLVFCALIVSTTLSCSKKTDGNASSSVVDDNYTCVTSPKVGNFSQLQLLQNTDLSTLQKIASGSTPNSDGSIADNKTGYFHVRFQKGVVVLAEYAIASNRTDILEMAVKAIEYSFSHMLMSGDFDFVVPISVGGVPSSGDRASADAFFLTALGPTLTLLYSSNFFNAPAQSSYKLRIENLRPQIQSAINFLKTQIATLKNYDEKAPNRLFYDALAFYSLGIWLNDSVSKTKASEFISLGLASFNSKGYFTELNGWDSSYNGVSTAILARYISLMSLSETYADELWTKYSCSVDWQKSRVMVSGEISTQGNTRVYIGGEVFLGSEKKVAWIDTLTTFLFFKTQSGSTSKYQSQIDKLISFYGN